MQTPRFATVFLMMFLGLSLTACGSNSGTPLALTKVESPLADARPEEMKPMTLIEATSYQGVPSQVAAAAMSKYDQFKGRVKQHLYISIIDFTQHSGHMRYFLINTKTGKVDAIPVAHGSGSDPSASGVPQYFSNRVNSKMSSLGAYLVSEKMTSSKHGTAMRLDGMESSNSNARSRAIILHSANYVKAGQPKQGMSWGCPAIPTGWISTALSRLANGTFMYAYGRSNSNPLIDDLEFVQGKTFNPAATVLEDGAMAPVDGVW